MNPGNFYILANILWDQRRFEEAVVHLVEERTPILRIAGAWSRFIPSGQPTALPVPDWLALHDGYDYTLIRGARAYALLPRTAGDPHVMELYSASGQRCGSLTFPHGGLTTGADGSVIASSGDGGCTKTVWPGLLR